MKKVLTVLLMLFSSTQSFAAGQKLVIQSGKQKHVFTIEIADTESAREQGLMFRETLGQDQGMLFIFKYEKIENFWMKNTLIPLDILFIKRGGEIVKIASAKPNDLTLIPSGVPIVAALEIKGGEAARLGLKAGNKIISPVFSK